MSLQVTGVISTTFHSQAKRQVLHISRGLEEVLTGRNLLEETAEVLARSSRVLREFTVATEVTPLALHWTMCMAAELHQSTYPESDWFNNCFKCS